MTWEALFWRVVAQLLGTAIGVMIALALLVAVERWLERPKRR